MRVHAELNDEPVLGTFIPCGPLGLKARSCPNNLERTTIGSVKWVGKVSFNKISDLGCAKFGGPPLNPDHSRDKLKEIALERCVKRFCGTDSLSAYLATLVCFIRAKLQSDQAQSNMSRLPSQKVSSRYVCICICHRP